MYARKTPTAALRNFTTVLFGEKTPNIQVKGKRSKKAFLQGKGSQPSHDQACGGRILRDAAAPWPASGTGTGTGPIHDRAALRKDRGSMGTWVQEGGNGGDGDSGSPQNLGRAIQVSCANARRFDLEFSYSLFRNILDEKNHGEICGVSKKRNVYEGNEQNINNPIKLCIISSKNVRFACTES